MNYYNNYFPKRWQYLDEDMGEYEYMPLNELSSYTWKYGNGEWEGYDQIFKPTHWDENLIFVL